MAANLYKTAEGNNSSTGQTWLWSGI